MSILIFLASTSFQTLAAGALTVWGDPTRHLSINLPSGWNLASGADLKELAETIQPKNTKLAKRVQPSLEIFKSLPGSRLLLVNASAPEIQGANESLLVTFRSTDKYPDFNAAHILTD